MNKESPVYIIVFMIIICAVFSFAISMVNYSTIDMLKKNEKLHLNRVLANAFMLKVPGENPEDAEPPATQPRRRRRVPWVGRVAGLPPDCRRH